MSKDVEAAFAVLREELQRNCREVKREISTALESGSFALAQRILSRAAAMDEFVRKTVDLEQEWRALTDGRARPNRQAKYPRVRRRKTCDGDATSYVCFRTVILAALVHLGGGGKTQEVLVRVGVMVGSQLTAADLVIQNGYPRWTYTAQSARLHMVKEGLLESGSPHGLWQISESGRRWLQGKQAADGGILLEDYGAP